MPQWKYFNEAEFIYNGEWSDSTLVYKGVEFNSTIVIDSIWERFNEDIAEYGLQADVNSEEDFTKYCMDNYHAIQELMELAIGNEI